MICGPCAAGGDLAAELTDGQVVPGQAAMARHLHEQCRDAAPVAEGLPRSWCDCQHETRV